MAVQLPIVCHDFRQGNVLGRRMGVGHEQGDDRAAVVVDQTLHLHVKLATLDGIQFAPSLDQELVEALIQSFQTIIGKPSSRYETN